MKSLDPDRGLESAVMAVRQVARLARRHRHDPPAAHRKPDGSTATELDIAAEENIRRILRSRHPGHGIVGEECPASPGTEQEFVWYVDPLDGTRVYARGQDNCCVAATLTREGVPILAAVAAIYSDELYTAVRGRPSLVNGRSIRVSPSRPLAEAEFLLYYDRGEPGLSVLSNAAVREDLGRVTVLPGSFILGACRTARGGYDVYLSVKRRAGPLMPWDLAPAALVLAGAGGILCDLTGRPIAGMIPIREVVAGNPVTAAEVVRRFGSQIRDPQPFLTWARREEPVFARLCGIVRGRPDCRVIGLAGAGGGIGKSVLARELAALLGEAECRIVQLDDYLLPRLERDARDISAHSPEASDLRRAAGDIRALRSGSPCTKPVYDHARGTADATRTVEPARFLILDGVQALHPELRPLVDLGVYIDAPAAVRARRIERDTLEKGVSEAYARKAHERLEREVERHLVPLRGRADVILAVDEGFRLRWVSPA